MQPQSTQTGGVYGCPVSAYNNAVLAHPSAPDIHDLIRQAPPAAATTASPNNVTHQEEIIRCRCVCWRLWVVLVACAFLVSFPFVISVVQNRHHPKFQVESMTVSSFNISDSSNKLTANWDINLSVRNKNKDDSFIYSDLEIAVFHHGKNLSRAQVSSFGQPPQDQKLVDARLSASALNISDWTASLMRVERSSHDGIDFEVHVRGNLWQGGHSQRLLMSVVCKDVKVVIPPAATEGSTLGTTIPCSTQMIR